MIEFLKHALGFCGDAWHPNIFTVLLGGLGFRQAFYYIKFKIQSYDKSKS
jgi:hypothetical protein